MRGLTWQYLIKRLAMFVLTLWLGMTIIFIIPRLAVGDPTSAMLGRLMAKGGNVENSQELIQRWKERFGLDQPIQVQYGRYLYNTITFNQGYSLSAFPATVDDLIQRSLPWTIGLLAVATVIAFVIGNAIGALMAWRGTPRPIRNLLPISLLFTSIPAFMLGIILIWVFSYTLNLLPYTGGFDRQFTPGWNSGFILNVIQHAILPATAVVVVRMGSWALGMRGMMITTDGEDYMVLAEAKGLPATRRFWNYGVRNAILPQVTSLGVAIGSIAGGFIIVEQIFTYPGIGSLLFRAIQDNDYTMIQGIVFYIILGVSIAVLILDLTYPLIDPRISLKKN
ncbi:MAG TPA: ABC transporter permease [Anaerolineae bacterium]|nr:ABC transporter permease [Anaerolineae bacterium]